MFEDLDRVDEEIINTETNKLVCVPPVKAVQEETIDSIDTTKEDIYDICYNYLL